MYCVYGDSGWYIHGGPLFGGGPLLGGSVIGSSTVCGCSSDALRRALMSRRSNNSLITFQSAQLHYKAYRSDPFPLRNFRRGERKV